MGTKTKRAMEASNPGVMTHALNGTNASGQSVKQFARYALLRAWPDWCYPCNTTATLRSLKNVDWIPQKLPYFNGKLATSGEPHKAKEIRHAAITSVLSFGPPGEQLKTQIHDVRRCHPTLASEMLLIEWPRRGRTGDMVHSPRHNRADMLLS